MQELLDVDLSLTGRGEGRKRPRTSGGTGDDHEDGTGDVGHAGGKGKGVMVHVVRRVAFVLSLNRCALHSYLI